MLSQFFISYIYIYISFHVSNRDFEIIVTGNFLVARFPTHSNSFFMSLTSGAINVEVFVSCSYFLFFSIFSSFLSPFSQQHGEIMSEKTRTANVGLRVSIGKKNYLFEKTQNKIEKEKRTGEREGRNPKRLERP